MDMINASKAKLESNHPNTLTNISSLQATSNNEGKLNEPTMTEKLGLDVMTATKVKPESAHLDVALSSITNQPPSNQDLQLVQQQSCSQAQNVVNQAC